MLKRLLQKIFRKESPSIYKAIHKEYLTKCDVCEYLNVCKKSGCVMACTTPDDNFEHYILSMGHICRREELDRIANDFADMTDIRITSDQLIDALGGN